MLKIAIIGYGYWGPNLSRNFSSLETCSLTYVADFSQERLNLVKKLYPSVNTTTSPEVLFSSSEVDAIVIATPVFTHFALAKKALQNGKHVLLEKPMTATVAEAEELINLAAQKGLTLMVDHTFLYTSAVHKMQELIDSKTLGAIKYFDSTRINLGLFQQDVNVLWDLAPHDISILNFLVKEVPYSVNSTGVSHTRNGIENIAYLTVNYQSDFIAHFNCSWTSPVKLRTMLVGGDKKMLVYNDLEQTEKIKIYDTTYDYKSDEEMKRLMVDYRTGDIFIPKLAIKEALSGMVRDFADAIIHKKNPVSDAQSGLTVVRILEASQKSIKNKGKEIIL
ncbi:MAG: Gfo/Idh/MocA family protein [Bacteroidia bacterium]